MFKLPFGLGRFPAFSEENIAKMDQETHLVTLVTGTEDDGVTPLYAFIKCAPSKLLLMREMIKEKKHFKPEDIGEVIKTGNEKTPPPEVMQEMREKWNFDPDFEKKSVEDVKKFLKEQEKEMFALKIAEMKKKKNE